MFPSGPWQRRQFHHQQNVPAYVPRLDLRAAVARAIRRVCDRPNRPAAEWRRKEIVAHFAPCAPKLAPWMEANLPQGRTVFALPGTHQQRLRTATAWERVNQESQRRTRGARLFPNEASLWRLGTALLAEPSEEWEAGKTYLTREGPTQPAV